MTAKSLRLLAFVAGFALILPAVENVAVRRQVVQPANGSPAPSPRSFYRGAVESPPPPISTGPGFQRSGVEYRPTPEFGRPNPILLRDFNQAIFLSQFAYPSLQVDYFRQYYPYFAQYVFVPQPAPIANPFLQQGN